MAQSRMHAKRLGAALVCAASLLAGCATVGGARLGSGIDASAADPTVRPQDDLYGHVNGGWIARTIAGSACMNRFSKSWPLNLVVAQP